MPFAAGVLTGKIEMQKSKQKLLSQQLSPPPPEVNVNSLVGGGGAVPQHGAFPRGHLLRRFVAAPAFVFYVGREGVPYVGTMWP